MANSAELVLVGFEPDHLTDLIAMWRESLEAGVGISDPQPLEEQERYLLNWVLPSNDVRLAFLDARLVGFVAA